VSAYWLSEVDHKRVWTGDKADRSFVGTKGKVLVYMKLFCQQVLAEATDVGVEGAQLLVKFV